MIWPNSISNPYWLADKLESLVRGLSNAPYLKMDCSFCLQPAWTMYSLTFGFDETQIAINWIIFMVVFNSKIGFTVYQFRGYARFHRQQYFERCCHAMNSTQCFVSISSSAFPVQLAPNTVNEMAIADFVNWCGCPCVANSLYGSALEIVLKHKRKYLKKIDDNF